MKLIHLRRKKGAGPVDAGAGAGSNARQVAPDDDFPFEATGYASSRDEAFFEASPWLDSDCEDDFFSVNGDATPARTLGSAATSCQQAVQKLPTLEAILKAEPLMKPAAPPPQQMKLADFLREKQESVDAAAGGEASGCCIPLVGGVASRCCIPRAGGQASRYCCIPRAGGEARGCCLPRIAMAISYKERRKRN